MAETKNLNIESHRIFLKLVATIVSLSAIGVGIFSIILGCYDLMRGKQSIDWPARLGVIISSEIRKNISKHEGKETVHYTPKILYNYDVDGIEYSSTRIFFGGYKPSLEYAQKIVNRYPIGKKIKVYYHPDKHNLSVLEPGVVAINYIPILAGVIFFSVGSIFFLVILIVMPRKETRRTEAIKKASVRLGMTYLVKDESLRNEAFVHFPLFQSSTAAEFRSVIRGHRDGFTVVVFDYHYLTRDAEGKTEHDQLVAAFCIADSNLPEFRMYPENVLYKIGKFFGMQDINFKDYPDFSNSYILQGKLEQTVRGLFSSEILRFFSRERGWFVEGGGEWLVFYRVTDINPDAVISLVERGTRISRLFSKADSTLHHKTSMT